jgi:hypothetical protein
LTRGVRVDVEDRVLVSGALHRITQFYTQKSSDRTYATFFSRSHQAVIRVYESAGNVLEAHEHKGDFKEW